MDGSLTKFYGMTNAPRNGNEKQYTVYGTLLMTLSQMEAFTGVDMDVLRNRIRKTSPEEAMFGNWTRSYRKSVKYEYKGKLYSVRELAEIAYVVPRVMRLRLKRMSAEEAVTMEIVKGKPPKRYEYNGELLSAVELARIAHISPAAMRRRLGIMDVKEAVEGVRRAELYEYHGKQLTAGQLAEISGFTVSCLKRRMKKGMSAEEAVDTGDLRGKTIKRE